MDNNLNQISNKTFIKAYQFDWVALVIIAAICGGLNFVNPFERFYFQNDNSIAFPLNAQTVPIWLLIVLSIVLPFVLVFVLSFIHRRTKFETNHAILSLLIALVVTILITDVIKLSAGRLRPNFLARCKPANSSNNAPCTGDPKVIMEGRKSFPSGHSSTSFAGLGYLAFYLAGKMRLFSGRYMLFKGLVVMIPLLIAYLIAVSRVDDYYHHWQDVLVGGILGLVVAYMSYTSYYQNLFGKDAGCPVYDRLNATPSRASSSSPPVSLKGGRDDHEMA